MEAQLEEEHAYGDEGGGWNTRRPARPAVGEARWEYDSGPYPYIRWRITDLEHDRPARCANGKSEIVPLIAAPT